MYETRTVFALPPTRSYGKGLHPVQGFRKYYRSFGFQELGRPGKLDMEKGQALTMHRNPHISPFVNFSSLVNYAFDMPYKTVLVTQGTIQNYYCKILIDPGAEINYISSAFAQRHKISTKDSAHSAEWVQGTVEHIRETNDFVRLGMGSTYSEELPFSVMPLHYYNVKTVACTL